MNWKEQATLNLGVWLTVYPSVLAISWLLDALGIERPLWQEILVSTALTVPLISYAAVPMLKLGLAKAEGKDVEELKD